jgi:hypothetical protein
MATAFYSIAAYNFMNSQLFSMGWGEGGGGRRFAERVRSGSSVITHDHRHVSPEPYVNTCRYDRGSTSESVGFVRYRLEATQGWGRSASLPLSSSEFARARPHTGKACPVSSVVGTAPRTGKQRKGGTCRNKDGCGCGMARGSWNFKQCQSCRFMLKKNHAVSRRRTEDFPVSSQHLMRPARPAGV